MTACEIDAYLRNHAFCIFCGERQHDTMTLATALQNGFTAECGKCGKVTRYVEKIDAPHRWIPVYLAASGY